MGGRGAKLDIKTYLNWSHEKRISEYEAIYAEENIKFLMQKDGTRTSTPIFSNTANRIYITLNALGKISGISKYNENHTVEFVIHEPHSNENDGVHVHSDIKSGRTKTLWDDMPKEQKDLYNLIKKKYEEYDILNKVKEWNKKHGR